jgi:xylose isomerase
MQLVVEHKHKIGFQGTLLIEPKPQEPTKHQYDYDASTVYGFLKQFGLEKEIKLNIEANHATLAGHFPPRNCDRHCAGSVWFR